MTKRRRVVRRATTAPPPRHVGGPTPVDAYGMFQQAVGNADQWWTQQGSAPPPLQIQRVTQLPGSNDTASSYAYYGTGQVDVADRYLSRVAGLLANPSLKVRREALAQMWGLAAHERGHNLNYQDVETGIMDPNLPAIPGQAYQWAAEMLPAKRKIHRRRR